ncbi:hypothetical protein RB213_007038 [Colletotrichum asianum]
MTRPQHARGLYGASAFFFSDRDEQRNSMGNGTTSDGYSLGFEGLMEGKYMLGDGWDGMGTAGIMGGEHRVRHTSSMFSDHFSHAWAQTSWGYVPRLWSNTQGCGRALSGVLVKKAGGLALCDSRG